MSSPSLVSDSNRQNGNWLAWVLFLVSLGIYAATRLIRLEAFPIYFFCDEAILTVQFRDLIHNGWHSIDEPHEFLPAYFKNAAVYNLSLSVYLQGLVSLMGGQSVVVVRATFAVLSITSAIAVTLAVKQVFRAKEWWSAVAFLTVIPCWFLHSRTGFECALMVSCYSWFIYFYLRYRDGGCGWIIPAMIAGAATFYSYAPAQGVMLATGILLLISDANYHWRNRVWVGISLALGVVLAFPYLRFRIDHPDMLQRHLDDLRSFVFQPIPLREKIGIFTKNYFSGFSANFWFTKNPDDMVRHVVPGHPHIDLWLVPFALAGIGVCFFHVRNALHRVLLIAVIASPVSGAMVFPTAPRLLTIIVPLAFFATLGFNWICSYVRSARLGVFLRVTAAVLLAALGAGLTREALADGPTYHKDYGLYGMQWGSQTVFQNTIPRYLESDPEANILVTTVAWNWPEVFPRFFGWEEGRRVEFVSFENLEEGVVLPEPKDLVVMSSFELGLVKKRREVRDFNIRETIQFPDGTAGFYIGHLYFDPAFFAEMKARKDRDIHPRWERLSINGTLCSMKASTVSRGRIGALWSKEGTEVESPVETAINMELHFDRPIKLGALQVEFIGQAVRCNLWGWRAAKEVYMETVSPDGSRHVSNNATKEVDSLRLEICSLPERATIIRRLQFLEN